MARIATRGRARCVISNRMPYGMSTLKLGTFSRWKEGRKTTTPADFAPSTVGVGNHRLANSDMEVVGRYPFSLDFRNGVSRTRPYRCLWYLARNVIQNGMAR